MQKKPRVDKRKNVGKVAEVLAKNPNKTEKELVKETWLWKGTVHRAKKEVEKSGVKDETIAYIVGASKARMKKAQAYFDRFLDESLARDELDNDKSKIIKDIIKDDLARITVLWGSVTDDEGGLKDLTTLTIQEIEAHRRLLLGDE